MVTRRERAGNPPAGGDVLVEVYRRVVEIDAALTEATAVDPSLHRWCEDRIGELLEILERAGGQDGGAAKS